MLSKHDTNWTVHVATGSEILAVIPDESGPPDTLALDSLSSDVAARYGARVTLCPPTHRPELAPRSYTPSEQVLYSFHDTINPNEPLTAQGLADALAEVCKDTSQDIPDSGPYTVPYTASGYEHGTLVEQSNRVTLCQEFADPDSDYFMGEPDGGRGGLPLYVHRYREGTRVLAVDTETPALVDRALATEFLEAVEALTRYPVWREEHLSETEEKAKLDVWEAYGLSDLMHDMKALLDEPVSEVSEAIRRDMDRDKLRVSRHMVDEIATERFCNRPEIWIMEGITPYLDTKALAEEILHDEDPADYLEDDPNWTAGTPEYSTSQAFQMRTAARNRARARAMGVVPA